MEFRVQNQVLFSWRFRFRCRLKNILRFRFRVKFSFSLTFSSESGSGLVLNLCLGYIIYLHILNKLSTFFKYFKLVIFFDFDETFHTCGVSFHLGRNINSSKYKDNVFLSLLYSVLGLTVIYTEFIFTLFLVKSQNFKYYKENFHFLFYWGEF